MATPLPDVDVMSFQFEGKTVEATISSEGALAFEDFDDYLIAENAVSSTEDRQILDSQLDAIEVTNGFTSLRRYLAKKVSSIPDDEDYETSIQKLANIDSDWFVLLNESINYSIIDRTLRTLLNKDGVVIVGDNKIVYRPDRMILFAKDEIIDFNNLPVEASKNDNFIVVKNWQKTSVETVEKSVMSCAGADELSGVGPEIDGRRVTSQAGVRVSVNLIRNPITRFPESYRYSYRYFGIFKSENRARFGGNWRQGTQSRTILQFKMGLGIITALEGNARSGNGWASNTEIRTIDVSWNPFVDGSGVVSYYAADALSFITAFQLEYLTSGVRDNNIEQSFVFACCPWTCEDENYDTF